MKAKIKKLFKTRRSIYITAVILLTIFAVVLNYAFAAFTNRETKVAANITVAGMEYQMMIDTVITNTFIAPANVTVYKDIIITSLNDIDSRYELIFIEEPGITIQFTNNTPNPVTGTIIENGTITIRLAITNTTNNPINIEFNLNAGFIHNTLDLTSVIIGPYTPDEIVITFNANGSTLNTPTGCTNSGNNRVCRCRPNPPATNCNITPPSVTRPSPWAIHGWRATNQNNSSGTAPSNTVSANATWFAITSRSVTLTNLVTNSSFENNFIGWDTTYGHQATIATSGCFHGTRCLRFPANVGTHILHQDISQNLLIRGQQYYGSAMIRGNAGNTNAGNAFQWNSGDNNLTAITFFMNQPFTNTTWARASRVETVHANADFSIPWRFRIFIANNTQDAFADALIVINLTSAFGAGQEPNRTWLDANINWFDVTINQTVWNNLRP